MSAPAISSTKATQRMRFRSLRLPKSGLLMTEARKSPESVSPVDLGLKPCAFWRNSEPDVPIAFPQKSLKLRQKLAPKKKSQRLVVGNNWRAEFALVGLVDSDPCRVETWRSSWA